jgi:hypothetical protein
MVHNRYQNAAPAPVATSVTFRNQRLIHSRSFFSLGTNKQIILLSIKFLLVFEL